MSQPHRLLPGVYLETVVQGGLQGLLVVLSEPRDALVGFGDLVWEDAEDAGLGLWVPLCHYLDVGGASVEHAHRECSEVGGGRSL